MQELTEFNLEKSTKRINELKKDLDENIKELNKYGITREFDSCQNKKLI